MDVLPELEAGAISQETARKKGPRGKTTSCLKAQNTRDEKRRATVGYEIAERTL